MSDLLHRSMADVLATYTGSDGDRTKALFAQLESAGTIGDVAVNLFRAAKNSERAKRYRGGARGRGSFRGMAYDRKSWAIDNLAAALMANAEELRISWGWGIDQDQPVHRDVLYVDLPTGQVSFHTSPRGKGPVYPGEWDGARGTSAQRICCFAADVLGVRAIA